MERKGANSAISVVIATLNEEEGIGPTIQELQRVLDDPHVVVVDGRSIDKTVEVAKNAGADILLQDKKGKGDALSIGVKGLSPDVRYVAFTDADFTYPAEYIPKMVEILEHNPIVGMVVGNRFNGRHNPDKHIGNPFYIGNRIIALAHQMLNGTKLSDPLSGLRVIRNELFEGWKPKSVGFDVEAEMNFHVERSGYQIVEIPIEYRPRLGQKKLGIRHGFVILRRIVTESLYT